MQIRTAIARLRPLLLLALVCAPAAAQQPASPPPAAPPGAQSAVASVPAISQQDLLTRLTARDKALVILDVRTPAEYSAGHVPTARNITHEQIDARLAELADARDKEIVVYCRSGRRSQTALESLRKAGYTRLRHLEGDYMAWQAAGQPTETAAPSATR